MHAEHHHRRGRRACDLSDLQVQLEVFVLAPRAFSEEPAAF
jgi:hypothetical protein